MKQLRLIPKTVSIQKLKVNIKSKFNLHYTLGITPKRVASNGPHLHGLVPWQHTALKKRCRGGELTVALRPIGLARESNLRPPPHRI